MTVTLVWAHMHTLPRRRGSRPGALISPAGHPARRGHRRLRLRSSSAGHGRAELASRQPCPRPGPRRSVGIDLPAPSEDPALIDPLVRIVVPKPGQLDVRPIPAQTLSAAAAGRHVTLTIDYTSGVEPCNILDSIVVAVGADAKTFAITLREGHGPQDVVCIEIAESKRAIVDLGDLAPGTYTISDTTGGAAPITVTVD